MTDTTNTKPPRRRPRIWPDSLLGQMLLAIAIAVLIGQSISAALVWRAQHARSEAMLVNSAAFRLLGPTTERVPVPADPFSGDRGPHGPPPPDMPPPPGSRGPGGPGGPPNNPMFRPRLENASPVQAGDVRLSSTEQALGDLLAQQNYKASEVVVVERLLKDDAFGRDWLARHVERLKVPDQHFPQHLIIAALRQPDGHWLTARLIGPEHEGRIFVNFMMQTLVLYLILVGTVALILRRIVRPLAALTRRVEDFAREPATSGQLVPSGPEDVCRLIDAHNAMETRVVRLLDEKDVMLGAIGHDLKTPLAALRVRIEAVDDDIERGRMAAVIADINSSLDDILSLARVGRPSDPLEPTELSALVAAVVEEFEDMGEDVTLGDTVRIVLPLRTTWVRRALRNLVSNAVRYGESARVTLERDGAAVLRIEDDGPGIPDDQIAAMMEPFTRLEASRNSKTGGSGLGLTLARAIAEQHGGSLKIANRRDAAGKVVGLVATLKLPLA